MAEHEIYFASEKQLRIYKARKIITQVLLYSFLTLVGLFILFPFWYMIITSFKSTKAFENEELSGQLVFYLNSTNFSFEQFSKVFRGNFNFGTFRWSSNWCPRPSRSRVLTLKVKTSYSPSS